ncbi:MAG: DUF4388 domain-containing protein, partial [Holophagales bacterium]|nr:DUF4388 domain-containing protein [Holophagales bacterium]
ADETEPRAEPKATRGAESEPKPRGEMEDSGARVIVGSLGVLSFAELTQAFSQTGKTGRLSLGLGEAHGEHAADAPSRGYVFFDNGRVRHAEAHGEEGIPAFAHLFFETEQVEDTAFRFEPMAREEIVAYPKTIDRTAQQLLLSAAVNLDESNPHELVSTGLWRRGDEDG